MVNGYNAKDNLEDVPKGHHLLQLKVVINIESASFLLQVLYLPI